MPIYSFQWAEFDWKQLKQKNQVMIRTQIHKNKNKGQMIYELAKRIQQQKKKGNSERS